MLEMKFNSDAVLCRKFDVVRSNLSAGDYKQNFNVNARDLIFISAPELHK